MVWARTAPGPSKHPTNRPMKAPRSVNFLCVMAPSRVFPHSRLCFPVVLAIQEQNHPIDAIDIIGLPLLNVVLDLEGDREHTSIQSIAAVIKNDGLRSQTICPAI